ncbi:MAG TPA: Bcr/CflA family multidrug efflux MFS transporter [Candidatus Ignatzschineria merdigallinarum]|uniref:Bcr/CflA family efflux transporter n=1 Tax=Candidatus Ignatzschineria merdigallinarum TaxID=2838621 RepID=A0A9D1Q5W0_9GAMM|nr:Bcr/CflA family multidrug efflux MFS transporter [Candidatus Ignatzschineria merdigallinarum]
MSINSHSNRQLLIIILAGLVAFGPLSIDMYLPSLTAITEDLGASVSEVKQTITFFLLGFSIGMFFYGPLSDHYGRKNLLIFGITIYLIATIGIIFSKTGQSLFIWRLLQALGGASASVIARAIVRDLFAVNDSAKILSIMHMITMIATLISPIIGSYLTVYFGWKSIFIFLFFFGLLALLACLFSLKESLPKNERSQSIGNALKAYFDIIKNRQAIGYIGSMSMTFAGMFVYITASPFVYMEHFGVTPQNYAYLFGLNIFAIMLAVIFNAKFVKIIGPNKMIRIGTTLALLSALIMFLLNSSTGGISFIAVIVGLFIFVGMTGQLSANCIAMTMSLFPREKAGAAAGLAVSLQFGLGGILSLLVSKSISTSPDTMLFYLLIAGVLAFFSMLLTLKGKSSPH